MSYGSGMQGNSEIIALLLGERSERRWHAGELGRGAQRLVRRADGRILLEAVESQAEFERASQLTGCFRRGTPIYDPRTREVIGYEMEEVPILRSAIESGASVPPRDRRSPISRAGNP